jgi:hypothetical protein
MALFGALLFLVTFRIYTALTGMSYEYTFLFLLQSFSKGTAGTDRIAAIIQNLQYTKAFIHWLMVPFVYLVFLSLLAIPRRGLESAGKVIILLGLSAVAVTLFYLSLISPFGDFFKYPFVTFAMLIMPAAYFLSELFTFKTAKQEIIIMLIAAGCLVGFAAQPFLFSDQLLIARVNFGGSWLLLIVILISAVLIRLYSKSDVAKLTLLLVLALTLGAQFGLSRTQALYPYPTKYHYGIQGFEETATYLKVQTAENEPIWTMKDIGYYVHNKYIENYSAFFDPNAREKLKMLLEERKVRYYVVTTGIGQDRIDINLEVKDLLERYATIDRTFGNYIIYKLNEQ